MDEPGAAGVRDEPDPDEPGDEGGLIGCDPHVAREREREAGARHRAVDRREDGFLERPDRADVRVVRLLERLADAARKLAELLEILPRAEPAAGSGDHDGPHLRIRRLAERPVERIVQRTVERVVDVGPVQGDR